MYIPRKISDAVSVVQTLNHPLSRALYNHKYSNLSTPHYKTASKGLYRAQSMTLATTTHVTHIHEATKVNMDRFSNDETRTGGVIISWLFATVGPCVSFLAPTTFLALARYKQVAISVKLRHVVIWYSHSMLLVAYLPLRL